MKFGMRVFTINCLARMGVIESIRSHSLLLSSVNESLLLISLFQDRPIFFNEICYRRSLCDAIAHL